MKLEEEEEEEDEGSCWCCCRRVIGGGGGGDGGAVAVGLRAVWVQWRKKPQEKRWVFSFAGCCSVFIVVNLAVTRENKQECCLIL